MKFKVVAFDLDGTLVDSKIDFAAMRGELRLSEGQDVLEVVASLSGQEQADAMAIIHRHEVHGANASVPIKGASAFLESLQALDVPCAIFTRNSRETAERSLKKHRLNYDLLISRDDAKAKPDPDGLWKIANSLAVGHEDLLFVGDYLYDLEAGLNAGVPTALYLPVKADFETAGAHFCFQTFEELATWFFE
jgi:HAD superfamily hydrolase (TIGR01549 family)